jgi:transcriptional regulator with XRE-family HTH domain
MYVPWRRLKYACTACDVRIPADDIESVFREKLRGLTVDQEEIGRCLDASDEQLTAKAEVLTSITSEEAALTADMEKLLDLYLTGGISKAAFSARHSPTELRRDQLRDEIARTQGELDAMRIGHAERDAVLSSLGDLHEQWPRLAPAEKRQIVEALVERITIAPDEIELELALRPLRTETGSVCASTSGRTVPFCRLRLRLARARPIPRYALTGTLGDLVRGRRSELGLSQTQAADRLGVGYETVGDWERGTTEPSLGAVPAIHDFLGLCPVNLPGTALGPRLRFWRSTQGLSLRAAARIIDIDPKTLARVEDGGPGDVGPRVTAAVEAHLVASSAAAAWSTDDHSD